MRSSCLLCEDYIGYFTTLSYCDVCRETKNIQRVYGKIEVLKILKDICLRDNVKRNNKIKNAQINGCYSPACKKNNLRSKDTEVQSPTNLADENVAAV